jgi:indole-3-glycerol phosphate synthase
MGLLSDMVRSSTRRVAEARERVPEAALRAAALGVPDPPRLELEHEGFDVIAELKLRSPSVGDLSAGAIDPVARLEAYAEGGAAVCSILTEPTRFDGELEHLRVAAGVLRPYGVPAMRKDFLVDPYQVLEARACGASGVLLIVRMVTRERLVAMMDCAAELGLFVLLEAFCAGDLMAASDLAREREGRDEQVLMGLNCRDLETLQIDFGRFAELRSSMPAAWPCVAESGVQSPEDAARVASLGYRLALVGTSLMKSAFASHAVRDLVAAGRAARN